MDSITVSAPAKINLFLKITGRRPDGYHDIDTLFEKITLSDTATFKKRESGIEIVSDARDLPLGEANLIHRAVCLLNKKYGRDLGVGVKLDKSIPIGAGLGGGSSDAAAALRAVNRLYALGACEEELREFAREIGADVPFFLSGASRAVGSGRGDIMEEARASGKIRYLLLLPGFEISAKDAYEWADGRAFDGSGSARGMLDSIENEDLRAASGMVRNDLEGLALSRDTRLGLLRDVMVKNGAYAAAVSGSGPALYGIFGNEGEVTSARKAIMEQTASLPGWRVAVTSTLTK